MAMREGETVNGWDQSKDSYTLQDRTLKALILKMKGLWMGTGSVNPKLTSLKIISACRQSITLPYLMWMKET